MSCINYYACVNGMLYVIPNLRMPRYHYERRYGGGHSTSASMDEDEQSGHDLASTRRMAAPRAISDATYIDWKVSQVLHFVI